MRNNHANQRVAREIAENRDQFGGGYDARAREIRAENARRAQAALARKPANDGDRMSVEFMRSIMSTPYAEVRS